MSKQVDFKADRTTVLDRELRGTFKQIASGRAINAAQSKTDVIRLSNERSEIITSRNFVQPKASKVLR